jgi:hypothetical protein
LKINSFVERFYYLLLALLFFAIYGIGYSLISYDLKKRTAHHLEQKMENSFVQYKFIYNMYKKDSKTLFRQIKQNEKITQFMKI